MSNYTIEGLGDPVNQQSAATKNYLDMKNTTNLKVDGSLVMTANL